MANSGTEIIRGATPDTAGEEVLRKYTDGAAHTAMQSGSVWSYGNWPNTLSLSSTGTGVNDNDVLFTAENLEPYDTHMIQASAGAVDVEVSLDGTTFTPAGTFAIIDTTQTASATRVVVTASTNLYMLPKGKYSAIRLVQNGATAATAILLSGVA